MLHEARRWCVSPAVSAEDLATKLSESTWTLCTAFEIGGYLFVNDSTGPDGAQEYAVLKPHSDGHWLQIESITFSWCSAEKSLDFVRRILVGEFDQADYAMKVQPRLETPAQHGTCHSCA